MAIEVINKVEYIYLSQIFLNFRNKQVIFDLKNINELHRTLMRAFPKDGNNGRNGRGAFNLLYRIDLLGIKLIEEDHLGIRRILYYPKIIIQSSVQPDWSKLPEGYFMKSKIIGQNPITKEISLVELKNALDNGRLLRFKILANPTKKVKPNSNLEDKNYNNNSFIKENRKKNKNSKRVPLLKLNEQIKWFNRKGEQNGFSVIRIHRIDKASRKRMYKKINYIDLTEKKKKNPKYNQITVQGVLFEGILKITDSDKFLNAILNGIGPEKSYGYGLLSIAPLY